MSQFNHVIGNRFPSSTNSMSILGKIALFIKGHSSISLFLFSQKIKENFFKNFITFSGRCMSDIKKSMFIRIFSVSSIVICHLKIKIIAKSFYRSWIGHFDSKAQSVAVCNTSTSRFGSLNSDTSLTINESCKIIDKFVHPVYKDTTNFNKKQEINTENWMKSGNTLTDSAEGNPEPSSRYTVGRCRDYLRGLVLLITGKSVRLVRDDIVRSLQKCKEYGRNVHTLLKSRATKMENQDVTTSKVIWQGNMTTGQRRKFGKLTGISA